MDKSPDRRFTATVILALLTAALFFQPVTGKAANGEIYAPGELYVKYTSEAQKSAGGTSPDDLLESFGMLSREPAFPTAVNRPSNVRGKISAETVSRLESLARIQRVMFPEDLDMAYIARKLSAHRGIEYAEPVYYQQLDVVYPNDPFFHPDSVDVGEEVEQDYLNFIRAPEAWVKATGDSEVVIAIIDSGTDWRHPDLLANVWTNPGEAEHPNDGEDNDGNGYEDDIHGWDFYGGRDVNRKIYGDNDPSGVGQPHGTHTAGIAAAVTDNGIGVASLSYNVTYMPVKVGSDSGDNLRYGYEGILYAAQNGADIINCSWGSLYYSRTAEEIVETALSMGVIIIASAGNENTDSDYYPIGYSGVFGVGAVDKYGEKAIYSNYGSYVDVSAPGNEIYSTVFKGQYDNINGTSMAAPIVSALAALLKSAHPDWDNDRILAQIAGTSVAISDDEGYLRGTGYIDAAAAMGDPVIFVEVEDYSFSDGNDGLFNIGETIQASFKITNCGEDISNLGFNIYSTTGYSTPSTDSRTIGALKHGDTVVISDITFHINDGIPDDAKEYIRLDFTAGEAVNFQVMDFDVNPSYVTLSANTISVSIDGKGHIGYVDYPDNSKGIPFVVTDYTTDNESVFNVPLLFEGGLMSGTARDRVANNVRGENQMVADRDFRTTENIQIETAPDGSQQKGSIVFNDIDAGESSNHVVVNLNTYSFKEPGNDQYVIFAYTFKNTGSETLEHFIPGLFLDFDVPDGEAYDDYMFYLPDDDILVITEDSEAADNSIFIGATVVGGIGSPWIIENARPDPETDHPDSVLFGIYGGFSESEKWQALSGGKSNAKSAAVGDVSMVTASEGFDLLPDGEKQVIFVIGYGLTLDGMKSQIGNALLKAADISVRVDESAEPDNPAAFSLKPVYPNPFNGRTTVSYYLPADTELRITIFDILGRKIETVLDSYKSSGEHTFVLNGDRLSSGIYILSIEAGPGMQAFRRFTVLK